VAPGSTTEFVISAARVEGAMADVMAIIAAMAMAFAMLHRWTDMNRFMAAQKLDGDYSVSVQNCNFIWDTSWMLDARFRS
jgi:hypothetical protein